jgi:hypothetical protein
VWVKENFSEMFEDIPEEPNMEISGIPALRIYSPGSPMAPSREDIYYMRDNLLFRIYMLDVDNDDNKELYEQILSTFSIEQ